MSSEEINDLKIANNEKTERMQTTEVYIKKLKNYKNKLQEVMKKSSFVISASLKVSI